ncbi:hypothetical protein [Longimicrobium sp.]|uniref:hypothetical protein n=1 Tax=Longimicrobium sp. TaxID=2029185 RepID=UPI002C43E8E8|nr:hypothetical protein [Longimicrobium sp.]HSU16079.1 hypothetical protein [Longimicrobium sp.]
MKDEVLNDPVLEEIWATRERIASRFDYDFARLCEYYMEFQQQFGDRLVPAPDVHVPEAASRRKPAA